MQINNLLWIDLYSFSEFGYCADRALYLFDFSGKLYAGL